MTQVEPDPANGNSAPSDQTGGSGLSSAGGPGGWIVPPAPAAHEGRGRRNGCLISIALVVVILVVPPLVVTAILGGSSASGPEMTSLGLGTGGSGCDLSEVASSFPVGVPIRSVLAMEPALAAGDTVAVKLEKDGVELVEARQTITAEEPTPCIYGTLPELQVGHYRMEFDVSSDQMPPIGQEFDVVP